MVDHLSDLLRLAHTLGRRCDKAALHCGGHGTSTEAALRCGGHGASGQADGTDWASGGTSAGSGGKGSTGSGGHGGLRRTPPRHARRLHQRLELLHLLRRPLLQHRLLDPDVVDLHAQLDALRKGSHGAILVELCLHGRGGHLSGCRGDDPRRARGNCHSLDGRGSGSSCCMSTLLSSRHQWCQGHRRVAIRPPLPFGSAARMPEEVLQRVQQPFAQQVDLSCLGVKHRAHLRNDLIALHGLHGKGAELPPQLLVLPQPLLSCLQLPRQALGLAFCIPQLLLDLLLLLWIPFA
mmetsp:Transcript_72420/g.212204  ORF Transcript_72420/g.212204 Transcript_72420/m.212204 type:complete len:293 (+) Transcript_72420:790-1668(+)